MTATPSTPLDQAALWNGPAGHAWVDEQDLLDRMMQPFADLLVGAVAPASRVLDVGCGTGSTTLAAARRLGPSGTCVGIDVSAPMLAAAEERARREGSRARFVRADAQTHAFEPASFDRVLSRFGVMFFDDPARAFANLRRAATEDAGLRFVAWRSAADNPFMTTAERAAAPLLPSLPARRADGPGQFAFADPSRVRGILESAGWGGVDVQPLDVTCTFPALALERYVTRLGPVGVALESVDAAARAAITERVVAAFQPFVHGDEVRFVAACWQVDARATGR